MDACRIIEAPWREPVEALAALADEPFALGLLSDGSARGRWSYGMRRPSATFAGLDEAKALLGQAGGAVAELAEDLPPFLGGLAGLACYEWGAVLEASAPQARKPRWPDLVGGLYPALLAFDHREGRVLAIGRGGSEAEAAAQAEQALQDLTGAAPAPDPGRPLAGALAEAEPVAAHEAAVAAVVAAIAAGEIFQANIARRWTGRLAAGVRPFDVAAALQRLSPSPFGAYLRLPGLALVSNSPERFVQVAAAGLAQSRPIKGTRPRGGDPAQDAALAAELLASGKDRAENLMIVDLMRNDLSRVCAPGTVAAPELFALESFSHVHHLVSTVTGRLAPGRSALDLFAAAFPPGSITGAPKLQAMAVIARHEPPRGPYCGALFWAGLDGGFDSSVLIRTLACEEDADGWRIEGRAGGGIVADSDPALEAEEADVKFAALRRALLES